jgi:hypothetical protein
LSRPAASAAAWQARAQQSQQARREQRVTIALALALLDADHHALGIDVADLDRHHLAGAKARAVGERQGRLVLQPSRVREQPCDLLDAQHHRQLARRVDLTGPPHRLRPVEGRLEQEAQARERRVDGGVRDPRQGQMQLEAAQILGIGGIG